MYKSTKMDLKRSSGVNDIYGRPFDVQNNVCFVDNWVLSMLKSARNLSDDTRGPFY